jgi:hypothetical protein
VHRNEKPLFHHLVGEGVELRRDRKAERIGGVVVDYQMKPSGLLGRQVGWLCALEDFELASRAGQKPDAPDLGRLLRARRDWPSSGNTANKRDEVPSPHEAFPESEDDYPTTLSGPLLCITAKIGVACRFRVNRVISG